MTRARPSSVLVVGGGPVGAVAALACAQRGFRVTLLEAEASIDTSPRAATTHPSTLEMIAGLGLLERFVGEGLVARYFQFWDRRTRERICEFDHERLRDETPYPFVVQTEQHKLARMAVAALRAMPDGAVHFSTRVSHLEQRDDRVRVVALGPDGPRDFTADWVIGADGGRSSVRRMLGIEFVGYTWPERFLVLTTTADFAQRLGCCYRNYLADPEEWTNLFKVAGDDGAGRGRVFLAGDAAHVNNPIGGLGLNCGIHDALDLADTLREVALDGGDAALLDGYERRRRALNLEYVQAQTVANKARLEERDPGARARHFAELRRTAADPARHTQFLMRTSLLESVRRAGQIA